MTTDWPAGEAAFVTGSASGIGLGLARALVAAGAKVALADIDGERLAQFEKELTDAGGTVTTVELDVSDADAWTAAADRAEEALGPISILCNVAGVNAGQGLAEDTPLKAWRWVYSINVEAQFLSVQTFLPRFKQRGGHAHILNTASMAGLVPMTNVSAYSSSKFASVGFTIILRDELKDTDITVSLLCPGAVATRLSLTAGEGEAKLLGRELDTVKTEANSEMLALGADPDAVGAQVLEDMQAGKFLIITHREWEPLIKGLHAEVERAFSEFDGRHGPDASALMLVEGRSPVAPTTRSEP